VACVTRPRGKGSTKTYVGVVRAVMEINTRVANKKEDG